MKRVENLAVNLSLIGVVAIAVSVRAGDPALDAQNKLLAKRAAEADCYRKLAETVPRVEVVLRVSRFLNISISQYSQFLNILNFSTSHPQNQTDIEKLRN